MKLLIEKVVTEFVYGGHLLSFGATGIVLTVILLLDLPIHLIVLLIPYLSSQVVYSYNHFREIDFDINSNPERARHLQTQKKWMGLFLAIYITLLLFSLITTNATTLIFVIFIVAGGILYTEYFKRLTVNLIAGFKNFYTSFFWALTILLVPFYYQIEVTMSYVFLFCFVFLRWMVNSAFFDIKDIESDRQLKLKTFAVLLGKKETIYLLYVINLISILPLLVGYYTGFLKGDALFLLITFVYGLYYLRKAISLEGKKLRVLSYIIVDAEYIFWPIVIVLAKIF